MLELTPTQAMTFARALWRFSRAVELAEGERIRSMAATLAHGAEQLELFPIRFESREDN